MVVLGWMLLELVLVVLVVCLFLRLGLLQVVVPLVVFLLTTMMQVCCVQGMLVM